MKRDVYKVFGECLVFTLAFAILLGFMVACSDSDDKDIAGGVSGDSGIVAIRNKQIAGVAQKGPFVKGSSIVLKETSAAGNLKPTGKEFFATTRSDSGDFVIDDINLESQFVRLTATGYYKRETTGDNTVCQISLNALSDISDRDRININILTHLEYNRTLYLIETGKSFAEAKEQARKEWMKQLGYKNLADDFEDLDIGNNGEADKVLEQTSAHFDECMFGKRCDFACNYGYVDNDCTLHQANIDSLAKIFSTSGELSSWIDHFNPHQSNDFFFTCIYEWIKK